VERRVEDPEEKLREEERGCLDEGIGDTITFRCGPGKDAGILVN
jgi:hypothetical protein